MTEFIEKARAHWTPERTKKITAGKKYAVLPAEAPELLRSLGLLNSDATMSADAVRKFVQINHMVQLVEVPLRDLITRHKTVNLFDAGCGSSFLSFLLAWCIKNKWNGKAHIVGVDNNPKLIEKCKTIAEKLGLEESLYFVHSPLESYKWPTENGRLHGLFSLHACDTATDQALALGLAEKADLLVVAPCCQAELAKKWTARAKEDHPLQPLFLDGNIRREIASHVTDAYRITLLRGCGYEVSATEFVPSQHTNKNRLMIAQRRGNYLDAALDQYKKMKEALGGDGILLAENLPPWVRERGEL